MAKPQAGDTTRVTVQAAPESTVFLDGKQQGRTDADGKFVLELYTGEHVVMVTHLDQLMQSQRFTVTAGQSERVVFEGQAAPQTYTTYEGRAGRRGELEGSPGMLWGSLGILALFVFVIVLNHRLFGRSERWVRFERFCTARRSARWTPDRIT